MTGKDFAALERSDPGQAHRLLFDEYYQYVYTIVYGRLAGTARREDIEECVGDVFAEVFLLLSRDSRYTGELRGVIASVAKRRAIDRFRAETAKKRLTVSLDDDGIDSIRSDFDIERDVEREQSAAALLEVVEALGEPDSTIIIQKYYFNKSSREIAALLSMKESAVRMRCKRALAKLREALEGVL